MKAYVALLAALVGATPLVAYAQTFHGNCSISATGVTLGAYNPFRLGHTDTVGNIAVSCSGKPGDVVSYTIALSTGTGGTFAQRRMRGATEHAFSYNVYTNASRTTVWGDGSNGSAVVADTFVQTTGRITRNYPVYVRAFGGQNIRVGSYSDAIVVTLNF